MSFEESCCANDGLSISRQKTYFLQNGTSANTEYGRIVAKIFLNVKDMPCL